MSELFDLELGYSADSRGKRPQRCLLKVTAPQMFRAGRGEVEFCRWLSPQSQKPAPLIETYGTLLDEPQSLAAILMEDRGKPLSPSEWPVPPQYPQCQQSVAALAQVHARWWGDADLEDLALTRPPPQQDAPRLAACTKALIDWQLWHVDFGVADLAYMLALHWFPERRRRYEVELIRHYVEHINASGQDYSLDQARSDYRFMVAGLLTKVVVYASVLPANIWWPHLERAFLAFDDLECSELVED